MKKKREAVNSGSCSLSEGCWSKNHRAITGAAWRQDAELPLWNERAADRDSFPSPGRASGTVGPPLEVKAFRAEDEWLRMGAAAKSLKGTKGHRAAAGCEEAGQDAAEASGR